MPFISHSAVRGFPPAAALIIAIQLPHILGVTLSRHEYIFPMILEILKRLPTFLIGLLTIGIIFGIFNWVFFQESSYKRIFFKKGAGPSQVYSRK